MSRIRRVAVLIGLPLVMIVALAPTLFRVAELQQGYQKVFKGVNSASRSRIYLVALRFRDTASENQN